jgi:ABC-2 type transport system ATP-binding protein
VGSDQIQVVVVEAGQLEEATRIVAETTGAKPNVDPAARSVTAPTSDGVQGLVAVAERLAEARIGVDDLGLHQPTLDEVFLTLTGSPASDEPETQEVPA